MAIVENWLPPSRENWEWICYVWQFFPVVRCAHEMIRAGYELMCGVCVGYGSAVGARVLSAGQNIDRIAVQCSGQGGMGHWRDHGASYPVVHLLHAAKGPWARCLAAALGKLDHGWVLCKCWRTRLRGGSDDVYSLSTTRTVQSLHRYSSTRACRL